MHLLIEFCWCCCVAVVGEALKYGGRVHPTEFVPGMNSAVPDWNFNLESGGIPACRPQLCQALRVFTVVPLENGSEPLLLARGAMTHCVTIIIAIYISQFLSNSNVLYMDGKLIV